MTTEPPPPVNPSAIQPGAPDTPAAPITPTTEAPASPPATPPKPLPAWVNLDYLLLVLLLALSFLIASFAASNADLWMNLAVGKRISEGRYQFGVDPFSWATEETATTPAAYWVNHAWLSSWLFYFVYNSLGGGALVVAKAVLFTAAMGFLCRIGWTPANRWYILICVTMAALGVSARLFMQPMIFSFLLLAITLYVLDRAGVFRHQADVATGDVGRSLRCLWWLPPLFALWANLDVWFILGPLVVGLCWAGSGIATWRGTPIGVPGKTLGVLFGVGLLACVVNPHHVLVFQLPTELAYLLVTGADAVKLPVPNALVASGRTVTLLQQMEPTFGFAVSGVSSKYWSQPGLGLNIAALAVAPLLILGMLGFGLVAFVTPQPGTPTFHHVRFLLWLPFLLLALALSRLIPFFALVAAPLTAMTLGEFVRWQHAQATDPARHERGLQFARVVSVPFMLALLYLVWVGWLNGPFVYNSGRRVAWQVREDSSMKRAVDTLKSLHDKGEGSNVFNIGLDLPNYCAWFAPDVKCGFDARYSLFVDQATAYGKARRALIDPRRPDGDWEELFRERKIHYLAPARFSLVDQQARRWYDQDRWLQQYVDRTVGVYSWSGGERRWPSDAHMADWNRLAFGTDRVDRRPPARGIALPQPLSFWELYSEGIGPIPASAAEALELGEYYNVYQRAGRFEAGKRLILMASATVATVSPNPEAKLTTLPTIASILLHDINPRDAGPPALPILMLRSARQAVAENPREITSYGALINAQETLNNSHGYWIRHSSAGHLPSLRERIRPLQQVAALYSLVQLQPEDYKPRIQLASIYMQNGMFDLAMDHWAAVERIVEKRPANDKEINVKGLKEQVRILSGKLRLRQTELKENLERKTPLQAAEFAFHGSFVDPYAQPPVRLPLGLGKQALDIVLGIRPDSLKPEEQLGYLRLRFDLLLAMGRVDVVADILREKSVRQMLPPTVAGRYQVLAGGVLGDYEMMDQGLIELEKANREAVRVLQSVLIARVLVPPAGLSLPPYAAFIRTRSLEPGLVLQAQQYDLYNLMTLRGIAALESGDTAKARTLFAGTLKEAENGVYFPERPIAQRYLELLEAQQKK